MPRKTKLTTPAFLKVIIYVLLALAIGAMIAPPIYWGGQALAESGVTDWLAKFPFHRVLSRCFQVSLIVLLWPAIVWVRAGGWGRGRGLNLERNKMALYDVLFGFVVAIGFVVLLGGIYVVAGWCSIIETPHWGKLWQIGATAMVVAVVEEIVFRGVILGVCLWSLPGRAAVFVTTVFFTAVHFIKPTKSILKGADVVWTSGFTEAVNFVHALPEGAILWYGVASLLVAGWILGMAALRTRSLWLPIGLHAGWVFGQQGTGVILETTAKSAERFLPWVGPNLVSGAVPTGVLPLIALVITGVLVGYYLRYVFRPVVSVLD